MTLSTTVLLASCEQEPTDDDPGTAVEEPTEEPGEAGPQRAETETEEVDEPEEVEQPQPTEEVTGAHETEEEPGSARDDVAPLPGEASTAQRDEAGEPGWLAVTDVEVAGHDGFDRVVFRVEGEGVPGWFTSYEDEPISDPSGRPMTVAGDVFLRVAIRNVALPPDLPGNLRERVWEGDRVAAPEGGVISEVVGDAIVEGTHGFLVGIDGERPYLIDRFEHDDGSHRVVLDVFDTEPTPAPLAGEPSTEPREAAGEPDTQFVHDVRVGSHDGFDRVVVEHSGTAPVGWSTRYSDDARARSALGLAEPGEAVLEIAIRDITPPEALDDEVRTWDEGPFEGPPGGVIEQVDAAIAAEQHIVVVGLPEELPYLAEYVPGPPGKLIVDIFHR